MGWLKLNRVEARLFSAEPQGSPAIPSSLSSVEHVEVAVATPSTKTRPRAHPSTPDAALPFISKDEIRKIKSLDCIVWIVIDNIIYDCTEFVDEHPGGAMVLRSFASEDCSWQFWRIHSRTHLEKFGKELRVGRTEGMKNRFVEIPRYVGLRRLCEKDDW